MKIIVMMMMIGMVIACTTNSNGNTEEYSNIDLSGKEFSGKEVGIRYNETRQTIDGFGGSDAWQRLPSSASAANEVVKLLFSKTEGAGFTILRNRIPFRERLSGDENPGWDDGFVRRNSDNTYNYSEAGGVKTFNLNWNSWDLAETKALISQIKKLKNGPGNDLVIMSTPWTPPNNRVTQWKETVTGAPTINGVNLNGAVDPNKPDIWGRLKKEHYNDYADLLADYVKGFNANMGHPLSILSIQNEPNMKVEYESCYWSGTDLRDFLKVVSDRFPLKGIDLIGVNRLGIMAPEYENYDVNFNDLIKPMLDDSVSNAVLTHIALHQYNAGWDPSPRAGTKSFPGITASDKQFWQTEISDLGPNAPKGIGIDNALYYARMIHFDMTMAETNAFLYWWLWVNSDNNNDFGGSLISVNGNTVNVAMRLYTMGQYSRFIRPGWVRIDCDTEPVSGSRVFVSAYKNPATKEIAIVVINDTNSAVNLKLNSGAIGFASLAAWRTSSIDASKDEKIKSLGNLGVEDGNAYVISAPKSVTSFYGNVK